jgi:hypothetical protein
MLRQASSWHERYALADDNRELAVRAGKEWGARPVTVVLYDSVDPGLLLFTVFVVRGFAEDSSVAVAATTSTTTAGG